MENRKPKAMFGRKDLSNVVGDVDPRLIAITVPRMSGTGYLPCCTPMTTTRSPLKSLEASFALDSCKNITTYNR